MNRIPSPKLIGPALISAAGVLLAGCGGPSDTTPGGTAPPAATWKSVAPDDPALLRQQAKDAYVAAMQVLDRVDAAPRQGIQDYPPEWRIKDVVGEPYLSQHMKEAAGLAQDGLGFRNGQLDPNPRTVREDLGKSPRSVVLSACPTGGEFFFTKSGNKAVGTLPKGYAKPPYQTTMTISQGDDGRWRLTNFLTDWKRTCTPSG